jgi:hypothetical protein
MPLFSPKNDQVVLKDMTSIILPVDEYGEDYLIENAEYGYGQHFINVTFQLRKMIQNNELIFIVNNERFGDPFPGNAKQLIIRCNIHGKKRNISVSEHATLNFSDYKE